MIAALPLLSVLVIAAGPQKDQARELVDRGNEHFDASRFPEAIDAYARALELYPSPRILVNLAEAQRQAGSWGAALVNFQKFIDEGGAKPGSRIHLSLVARIREIQERAARLVISGVDQDVEITIDGVPAQVAAGAPILLAPGRHELIARSPGRARTAMTVMLEEGATLKLPIMFAETPRPSPVERHPLSESLSLAPAGIAESSLADASVVEQWWFWTIVGVVVIGAAAGTMALSSGDQRPLPSELGASRFSTWEGPR